MKKDIEWLKEEIGDLSIADTLFISDGVSYIDSAVSVMSVYDLIDQLDEPEVLSREWIANNQERIGIHFLVNVTKLQNLVVPKQEITFDEVHDKLREESILSEKSFDYYWNCINDNVEMDEPGNLVVPKQEELESKIKVLIEAYKQEDGAYSNPENGWISGFVEDLKNLVEEEQKYYVDLDTAAYVAKWKDDDRVGIYTDGISGSDGFEFHLTEQEIKNYDERFWPFAKPVE